MKRIVCVESFFTQGMTCQGAWGRIAPVVQHLLAEGEELVVDDKYSVAIGDVAEFLDDVSALNVHFASSSLEGSLVTNNLFDVFVVSVKRREEGSGPWGDEIALRLASEELIYGRMYCREFNKWQNAKRVEVFERAGRAHEHLPKRNNGLPEPYNDIEIDVSANPGRRMFCKNYIEAVGAVMWIGPQLKERTGGDWRDLQKYDWCRIEHCGEMVRIQSWDGLFNSDQGEQKERQETLRKALFPKPCVR